MDVFSKLLIGRVFHRILLNGYVMGRMNLRIVAGRIQDEVFDSLAYFIELHFFFSQ